MSTASKVRQAEDKLSELEQRLTRQQHALEQAEILESLANNDVKASRASLNEAAIPDIPFFQELLREDIHRRTETRRAVRRADHAMHELESDAEYQVRLIERIQQQLDANDFPHQADLRRRAAYARERLQDVIRTAQSTQPDENDADPQPGQSNFQPQPPPHGEHVPALSQSPPPSPSTADNIALWKAQTDVCFANYSQITHFPLPPNNITACIDPIECQELSVDCGCNWKLAFDYSRVSTRIKNVDDGIRIASRVVERI